MTFGSAVALFGVMLVLAAVPSTSVMIVVSRSAASGFIHGFLAALGIVTAISFSYHADEQTFRSPEKVDGTILTSACGKQSLGYQYQR